MSVQTNTSVQLTTPPINTNTTPSQYLDQAIALETLKLMDKTLNNGRWTWAVVGTVFFIISLDGVKRIIINLIDKSINYLCNMTGEQWTKVGSTVVYPAKLAYRGITYPYHFIHRKLNKNLLSINENEVQYMPKMYPLVCNESMWKLLYTNLASSTEGDTFTYSSEIIEINNEGNCTVVKQRERWSNMRVTTSEFTVQFVGTVEVVFHIIQTSSLPLKYNKMFISGEKGKQPELSLFQYSEEIANLELVDKNEKKVSSINNLFPIDVHGNSKLSTTTLIYYIRNISISQIKNSTDLLTDASYIHPNDVLYFIPNCFQPIYYAILSVLFQKKVFFRIVNKTNYFLFESDNVCFGSTIKYSFCNTIIYRILSYKFLESGWTQIQLFLIYLVMLYIAIGDDIEIYKMIIQRKKISMFADPKILVSFEAFSNNMSNESFTKDHQELKNIKKNLIDEHICSKLNPEGIQKFRIWFLIYIGVLKKKTKDTSASSSTENNNNSSFMFYIYNNNNNSINSSSLTESLSNDNNEEVNGETFSRYLTKLSNQTSSENGDIESKKVKINYIKVNQKKIENKVKNPEFDNWMTLASKVGIIKDNSFSSNTDSNTKGNNTGVDNNSNLSANTNLSVSVDFMKSIPPEYIVETNIETNIEQQHLNSVYKGFHTLYLQTADKKRLFNCLDNFKNRKQLLQELGFPLKLGILLYGLPGTGKSATILSIASYLQKDIFYVDLRTVKSNKDLKMIFDHILEKNLSGGIIVMEDIDCVTSIVHKRSDSAEKNTTDILSEEKDGFTLDYLLNILQGTLTRDNTVFVITTNYVDKLDDALIRDGRIDVKIEMKLTNREQLVQMWKTIFKREINGETLSRFEEFKYPPATILARCAQYLSSGGTVEENDNQMDEEILKPYFITSVQTNEKDNNINNGLLVVQKTYF
jgi:ATP-dependent 26S proteasome regulatory subunit